MTTHVTGYVGKGDTLTTWDGRVILACRSQRTRYGRDGAFGLQFRLTGGRAVAGYALGEGMLFRGVLVYANQDIDCETRAECDHWADIDAETQARFDYEQSLETE